MNKILIIVDPQYGFIDGGLSVNNAKEKMNALADYIVENGLSYKKIIITVDWHLPTHCSFIENGGIWVQHCVQFTKDAAIYQPIINALNKIKADYTVLTKGVDEDHEEYSIFKNIKSSEKIKSIIQVVQPNDIDVTGIAFDFCVKETAIDLKMNVPLVQVHVLNEFSPSVSEDNEKDTLRLLEHNNVLIN